MKLCVLLLYATTLAIASVFAVVSVPNASHPPEASPAPTANEVCTTKLCFALDGSQSVSRNGFQLQKRFVAKLVNSLLSDHRHLQLAAVQYGLDNQPISPLTSDVKQFLGRLNRTNFDSSHTTFVRGGIVYCDFEITASEDDRFGAIVVMGDGRANFGGDPVRSAELFREIGGSLYAVAVGQSLDERLTEILGGDPTRVFTLESDSNLDDCVQAFRRRICHRSNDQQERRSNA